MSTKKEILVFANWLGLTEPFLMGVLTSERLKGKEIFAFNYSREWLNSNNALLIDPALQHFTGPQYLADDKINFGVFLDSAPDRWGRLLMRRRESFLARKENRKEKTLFETDYLMGVYDAQRMGAIRFKESMDGVFLNDNQSLAAPPFTSLKELEFASTQLERADDINDKDYLKWLNMLLIPGSSLGGARPKASVVDVNQQLWIAKFPSIHDDQDIGCWEMIANELAIRSGLNAAESIVKKFSKKRHCFLTKRFDRTKNGERIHFASAITLLGLKDGVDHSDGISYLHIAEFIMQQGANPNQNLEELWRRIVFNICISNSDDHLRNHGFILTDKGWILSPAYDLNPIPGSTGLKLNISLNENSLDLELALSVASLFRLNNKRALEIINQIKEAIKQWKYFAEKYKISKNEQEMMESAFYHFK